MASSVSFVKGPKNNPLIDFKIPIIGIVFVHLTNLKIGQLVTVPCQIVHIAAIELTYRFCCYCSITFITGTDDHY